MTRFTVGSYVGSYVTLSRATRDKVHRVPTARSERRTTDQVAVAVVFDVKKACDVGPAATT